MRRLPALLLVALAVPSLASAADPRIRFIKPVGAQRGTEVEVTVAGNRLGDAQAIFWYQPGIETGAITKVDDNSVKVKLKLAADCPLGLHDFRVRTAGGVSELQTFSVGALPEVEEKEPNNDFAAPQAVPMDHVVNGVAGNEDIDYYSVTLRKGERLTAEVEGFRLGLTQFDPFVAILDSKRFELASSDDTALVYQDARASIVAPEDGTYVLAVRESAYAGNDRCLYRLHVGQFPRPTATVPAGGQPGQKVTVTWVGDPLGTKQTEVTLPDGTPDPNFGLFARDEKGVAPYPNVFRLSTVPNVVEAEPNDDPAKATAATVPAAFNGVIEKDDDADYFAFKATKGQVFDVQCYARRIRSPLDSVMHVAIKGGKYLQGADDSGGPDSGFRFTAPEDAEYVLWVHDHLKKGGPDYAYRVEVTPAEPKLVLSTPAERPRLGTGVMAVAVPKGNRQVLLLNAARADWGGDVKLDFADLPPGVTATAEVMPANQGTVPVLFEAKADAPLGGTLARPTGTPTDEKVKLASNRFASQNDLVLGDNNVTVWERTVDTLAVAVTEEAPFSIEVVEPKVPLVRSGTMGLKVRAKRKEGFTAPIALVLPWLPPGVGASGGVSIAEKADEAVIPMNADGNAELKTWKVVVNGTAETPAGRIRVSSQLAPLTIAERFVQLAFQKGTVEQGKETDLLVKVQKLADFPGEATVTLVGLPNKATTDAKTITKDSTELVFHVKTAPDTPAGNHQNLFCQVIITQDGEPITHNLGSTALRVDAPIAPKAAAPATAPAPAAAPAPPPAAAPAKPLSRLEMLRQEQAEKLKAAAGAKP
jgi:hypothetical protein